MVIFVVITLREIIGASIPAGAFVIPGVAVGSRDPAMGICDGLDVVGPLLDLLEPPSDMVIEPLEPLELFEELDPLDDFDIEPSMDI